jgi:hypothetical protein
VGIAAMLQCLGSPRSQPRKARDRQVGRIGSAEYLHELSFAVSGH